MNEEESKALKEEESKALEALEATEREMLHTEHEMEREMVELRRDIAKAEEAEQKLAEPSGGTEAW